MSDPETEDVFSRVFHYTSAVMAALGEDGVPCDEPAYLDAVVEMGDTGNVTATLMVWAEVLASTHMDGAAALDRYLPGIVDPRWRAVAGTEGRALIDTAALADSRVLLDRMVEVRQVMGNDIWHLISVMAVAVRPVLISVGGLENYVEITNLVHDCVGTLISERIHGPVAAGLAAIAAGYPDAARDYIGGFHPKQLLRMMIAIGAHILPARRSTIVNLDETGMPVSMGAPDGHAMSQMVSLFAALQTRDQPGIAAATVAINSLDEAEQIKASWSLACSIGDRISRALIEPGNRNQNPTISPLPSAPRRSSPQPGDPAVAPGLVERVGEAMSLPATGRAIEGARDVARSRLLGVRLVVAFLDEDQPGSRAVMDQIDRLGESGYRGAQAELTAHMSTWYNRTRTAAIVRTSTLFPGVKSIIESMVPTAKTDNLLLAFLNVVQASVTRDGFAPVPPVTDDVETDLYLLAGYVTWMASHPMVGPDTARAELTNRISYLEPENRVTGTEGMPENHLTAGFAVLQEKFGARFSRSIPRGGHQRDHLEDMLVGVAGEVGLDPHDDVAARQLVWAHELLVEDRLAEAAELEQPQRGVVTDSERAARRSVERERRKRKAARKKRR